MAEEKDTARVRGRLASSPGDDDDATTNRPPADLATASATAVSPIAGGLRSWRRAEAGLLIAPFERHPEAARYLQITRHEALRQGLVRGADVRRFERFAVLDALIYPRASFEMLAVCGGLNQWLFLLDDACDTHPEIAASEPRLRALIEPAFQALISGRLPGPSSPFAEFSALVGARLRARASARLWNRFLEHTFDCLFRGCLSSTQAASGLLPLETLRELRRLDSKVDLLIDLVELSHTGELSPEEQAQPAIRELRELVVDQLALLNDLVSYNREVDGTGCRFNLLHALQAQRWDGSLERAKLALVSELNALAARFEAVASTLGGRLALYAEGLRHLLGGYQRFAFHSGRYHHPTAHLPELRQIPLDDPAFAAARETESREALPA